MTLVSRLSGLIPYVNMKYFGKLLFVVLLLSGALGFGVPSLHAHGRYLRQAAKKAAQNPKQAVPRLKAAQRAAVESQSAALQQVRRELIRIPSILQNKDFKTQLDLLEQMGIQPAPTQDARALFNQISQVQEELSPYTYNQPFPLKFSTPSIPTNGTQARSRAAWDAYVQSLKENKNYFSWQSPSTLQTVYVGPAHFPANPKHPLYPCGQIVPKLVKERHDSLSEIFDIIFNSSLTQEQKLALARHISQTTEVIGADVILRYFFVHKQIPAVKLEGWTPSPLGTTLLNYLRHKEIALIERLKQGAPWTDKEANLFLDLASILPEEESHTMLAALTYLGPSSAQHLLLYPQTPQLKQMQAQINHARQKGITAAERGLKKEASSQAVKAYIKLLRKRIAKHFVHMRKLEERIASFEFAQQQMAKTAHITPTLNNVSEALYAQAYYMRIKNLYNKLNTYMEDLEEELHSLQAFFPEIEQ